MLTKIDALTGQALMRLWGVPSWPDIFNAHYFLWAGVGVFSLIDHGTHVDLHMAMKCGERHRCRDAVTDILKRIGNREIHAPILMSSKHVCNLARKFGFEHSGIIRMEFTDGTFGDVILMIKR
ncbi:hypothetical protein ACIOG3_04005 [Yersinia rochesterensis]|uniref:hypothetical protein n=1 Tax=Yersinia rochesterensis TaxID=1604335 RepID=UPI0004F83ACD|nr:hypothetical protein [Yersinia rochesterensis]AIN19822.1 hypothetical protein DJ57_2543 [Yersinia rochesterensis]